jgi:hypothetical protein
MPQETAADVTHVVHWIPPDLIRSRKWLGRKADRGYWELQALAAFEAGGHAGVIDLDRPDVSCASPAALAGAVSEALGYPVSVEEIADMNGKGMRWIPDLPIGPRRWLDAPFYDVRPAAGS